MDLKLFLLLSVLFIDVNCQYDFQHAIDQTQYLQQLEKYGASFANYLYPNSSHSLSNQNKNETTNWHGNNVANNTGLRGSFNNSTGGSFNSTERFLNKTISSMARGVCVKEVP